jgi:hypothetical protein
VLMIGARRVHIRVKPVQAEPSNPRIQLTVSTGYAALQCYFEKTHKKTNRSRSSSGAGATSHSLPLMRRRLVPMGGAVNYLASASDKMLGSPDATHIFPGTLVN